MTVYVPTDLHQVHVSRDHGGCGLQHEVSEDHTVDCDTCAPALKRFHGASGNPKTVQKTQDEIEDEKTLSREGEQRAKEVAAVFAQIAASALAQSAPAPTPEPAKATAAAKAPRTRKVTT